MNTRALQPRISPMRLAPAGHLPQPLPDALPNALPKHASRALKAAKQPASQPALWPSGLVAPQKYFRLAAASNTMPPPISEDNLLLLTDSYKMSHYVQYPKNTQYVAAYFESRAGARFDETVFFGLQYYMQRYLTRPITRADIDEAEQVCKLHMPDVVFNRQGWQHILEQHAGRLPISIKAVPEGTPVLTGNVLMTVENTDPHCYWLTNYLETLLTHVWYPSTVATQSREMKRIIARYLEQTGNAAEGLPFKLHDFGFRGVSSVQSAGMGAAAHLLSFQGTDTLEGIRLLRNHYDANMAGFSIPAAEHSTITSWTKPHELDAYRNMLDQYPTGAVAIVSDSYDSMHACKHLWGEALKPRVLARDGITVIRPDSGDPTTMVLKVHEVLGEAFGVTTNEKGYKTLHPKIAIMQGDGIDIDAIESILGHLKNNGWSTNSLALGSGGGLLQKLHRDTQKFAFKASAAQIDGAWVDVYKDPVTDSNKRSKRGRLKLMREASGEYKTVRATQRPEMPCLLREVFRDGHVLIRDNLETVRQRAELPPRAAT